MEISNFDSYRPLFRAAMERFLSSTATPDLAPARKSSLSDELQSLLQKPWMSMRGARPGLNEFSNETMGVWLESALKDMKVSFYVATRTRKGHRLERRKTVPVLHNNTQFPVNLYWASRPLSLPPSWQFPDRAQLKLSPKLLSATFKP